MPVKSLNELREEMRAVARGERKAPSLEEMGLPPSDTLGAFLDDWEAQHGPLTPGELATAADVLADAPQCKGDRRLLIASKAKKPSP